MTRSVEDSAIENITSTENPLKTQEKVSLLAHGSVLQPLRLCFTGYPRHSRHTIRRRGVVDPLDRLFVLTSRSSGSEYRSTLPYTGEVTTDGLERVL